MGHDPRRIGNRSSRKGSPTRLGRCGAVGGRRLWWLPTEWVAPTLSLGDSPGHWRPGTLARLVRWDRVDQVRGRGRRTLRRAIALGRRRFVLLAALRRGFLDTWQAVRASGSGGACRATIHRCAGPDSVILLTRRQWIVLRGRSSRAGFRPRRFTQKDWIVFFAGYGRRAADIRRRRYVAMLAIRWCPIIRDSVLGCSVLWRSRPRSNSIRPVEFGNRLVDGPLVHACEQCRLLGIVRSQARGRSRRMRYLQRRRIAR